MAKNSNPSESAVLYRKYRPFDWSDVIGQDHVVSVLEGSIKLDKVSHAYLFSGSRGTGKTSIARIFARALDVSDNDIYEIDAASNRGIDDIREIRDGVSALPFESKYKVYIIDEVHMLSKSAFGSIGFLKKLPALPITAGSGNFARRTSQIHSKIWRASGWRWPLSAIFRSNSR